MKTVHENSVRELDVMLVLLKRTHTKTFKSVLFGWFFFLSRFVPFFSVEKRVV